MKLRQPSSEAKTSRSSSEYSSSPHIHPPTVLVKFPAQFHPLLSQRGRAGCGRVDWAHCAPQQCLLALLNCVHSPHEGGAPFHEPGLFFCNALCLRQCSCHRLFECHPRLSCAGIDTKGNQQLLQTTTAAKRWRIAILESTCRISQLLKKCLDYTVFLIKQIIHILQCFCAVSRCHPVFPLELGEHKARPFSPKTQACFKKREAQQKKEAGEIRDLPVFTC